MEGLVGYKASNTGMAKLRAQKLIMYLVCLKEACGSTYQLQELFI